MICDNLRFYLSIRNYISIFAPEFAALIVALCCTKYECFMYIHERDNWTNFRWDASEVSISKCIVQRKETNLRKSFET